jgi:hypothetical protein
MPPLDLPFEPLRRTLYTPDELFAGITAGNPLSYADTRDFAAYRHFVTEGRNLPDSPYTAMMQALHDSSIGLASQPLLRDSRPVAIMGGHKMKRSDPAYRHVAALSRRLTRRQYLLCSGGGPGAMEATHLGSALATRPDEDLDRALAVLAAVPEVPNLSRIVAESGSVDSSLVADAHRWFLPAWQLAADLGQISASLAVPTWHYGHEPTTPLAPRIAKYFQNSIREDGLLALARHGVIYSEGRAGTVQEVFQDAAQNFYRSFKVFSPMVFLGADFWTKALPVLPLLASLLPKADFEANVLVTDDINQAAAFIEAFEPTPPSPTAMIGRYSAG